MVEISLITIQKRGKNKAEKAHKTVENTVSVRLGNVVVWELRG